jgi:hypothetical protein
LEILAESFSILSSATKSWSAPSTPTANTLKGVEDLPAAVHEYGDWVSLLLTHPVPSLDNYEKLFENLSTGRGVIKVFCNV